MQKQLNEDDEYIYSKATFKINLSSIKIEKMRNDFEKMEKHRLEIKKLNEVKK